MKKIMIIMAGVAVMAGTILSGCDSSTKKVETARENMVEGIENLAEAKVEINNALQDSIQTFNTDFEQKINFYDKRITKLKAKAGTQKKENKAAYDKALKELELKSNQLKKKLQEYKNGGLDNWTSFEKELKHDMNELGEAITDLKKNNVK